jgi:outer membrane protein assembly factor BamE (lipoprotein component of BamABCDE complex)
MRDTRLRSALLSAGLGAVLLLSPGCLFGWGSETTVRGTYVSQETLAKVEAGDDREEVTSLLGEPTSKASKADGTETWRWRYTEATTTTGTVFLLLGSKSKVEKQNIVYVDFDADGKVVKTWRD